MKKTRLLTLALTLLCIVALPCRVWAWSEAGHRAIAYIAEQELTPEARSICHDYLRHTLTFHAVWMDNWRYHPDYVYASRWHAVGIKLATFELGCADAYGDGAEYRHPQSEGDHFIAQLDRITKELKDHRNLPRKQVELNLKLLIHMVGDMHCPVHAFYDEKSEILGRLQREMKHKGKSRRIHGLWDQLPLSLYTNWSSEDFYHHLCTHSAKERREICKGTPLEWLKQMTPDYLEMYNLVSPDIDFTDIPQQNKVRMQQLCNRQLAWGGYRLASILNSVFTK